MKTILVSTAVIAVIALAGCRREAPAYYEPMKLGAEPSSVAE